MNDETQITRKPGAEVPHESYIFSHNLSGRFWIAMVMALGFVFATIIVMVGQVKLDSNAAIAVYTGFAGAATGLIGSYMGQNQKQTSAAATTPATAK
jgi:hypothetical protein